MFILHGYLRAFWLARFLHKPQHLPHNWITQPPKYIIQTEKKRSKQKNIWLLKVWKKVCDSVVELPWGVLASSLHLFATWIQGFLANKKCWGSYRCTGKPSQPFRAIMKVISQKQRMDRRELSRNCYIIVALSRFGQTTTSLKAEKPIVRARGPEKSKTGSLSQAAGDSWLPFCLRANWTAHYTFSFVFLFSSSSTSCRQRFLKADSSWLRHQWRKGCRALSSASKRIFRVFCQLWSGTRARSVECVRERERERERGKNQIQKRCSIRRWKCRICLQRIKQHSHLQNPPFQYKILDPSSKALKV